MTIKLSKQAADTLDAFPGGAQCKGDLGQSWTDAKELAAETGYSVKQIKGYLSTLAKKGLIHTDEEGSDGNIIQCLSEEGCDWLAEHEAEAAEVDIDDALEEIEATEEDTLQAILIQHGYNQPRNLCRALRAAARDWRTMDRTRKSFLEGCVAMGLKENNAAAEWQASTQRAD